MVDTKVAAQACDASDVHGSAFERFPARETSLGTKPSELEQNETYFSSNIDGIARL